MLCERDETGGGNGNVLRKETTRLSHPRTSKINNHPDRLGRLNLNKPFF